MRQESCRHKVVVNKVMLHSRVVLAGGSYSLDLSFLMLHSRVVLAGTVCTKVRLDSFVAVHDELFWVHIIFLVSRCTLPTHNVGNL